MARGQTCCRRGQYDLTMIRGLLWSIVFNVVVAAFLLIIVTKNLGLLLPSGLATRIGHNSESLAFALLFCASIQFLRPALLRLMNPWLVAVPTAAVGFALGLLLEHSSLPPTLVTLNEPVIATSILVLYTTMTRPLRFAPAIGAVALVLTIVFFRTSYVLDQAESMVPLILAPFALDVFDRTILEPGRSDRSGLRAAWCVALVVVGVGFILLAPGARENLHGFLPLAIDYGQRASEAYWGWLLVHLYFWPSLGGNPRQPPSAFSAVNS